MGVAVVLGFCASCIENSLLSPQQPTPICCTGGAGVVGGHSGWPRGPTPGLEPRDAVQPPAVDDFGLGAGFGPVRGGLTAI